MSKSIFIGFGASDGGLHVFQNIIGALATNRGYVYIIAQHLDSNKKSALAQILSKYTTMQVSEISQETLFLPNSVYIVPSGYNLVYKHAHLKLEAIDQTMHTATPCIDKLFEALALYKKENSVAILLTGTGHDGTEGVKIIKKNGGITIAQSPQEAEYKSMPLAAINTNRIDYVLKSEQITAFLPDIISRNKELLTRNNLQEPLNHIQKMLTDATHLDINKYKHETIMRRIHKRMWLAQAKNLEEYLLFIQNNPEELQLLHDTILIGVTSFFRDKEAFEALKTKLFHYLQDKPEEYELRIWSVACATGEEAYSLAILIAEISEALGKTFHLQIMATDIDANALKKARSGIFADELLQEMDTALKKKYFTNKENNYHVVQAIRNKIIFSHHNVLSDPPFIKLDLISCRNFLIYIVPSMQQEIFKLFHYSLKEKGLLFLGSSESVFSSNKYFEALNSESKIYKKEYLKEPTKISSQYFSQHTNTKNYETAQNNVQNSSEEIEQQIASKIFDFFAPNFVLIDKNYSMVYKKGDLPFLSINDGFVSLNILDNLDKSLRYDVKVLINLTFESQFMQESKFIETTLHQKKRFVKIVAHPFEMQNSSKMLLLYFQFLEIQELQYNTKDFIQGDNSYMIENLTQQLEHLKEDNHLLSDQLIITKENMQLFNEELQSSNEELQSSNEELETSNEELKTSNEELHLSMQSEQLLQKELSNILNSSIDGIIGLDIDGKHSFVNDATCKLLGYTKEEMLGKNAHKLWHHTKVNGEIYPREECTLHYGLNQGKTVRTKDLFWKKDGTSIKVEVSQSPIIDKGKIHGAVLTFHDITKEEILTQKLQKQEQLYQLTFEEADVGIAHASINGKWIDTNEYLSTLLGYTKEELSTMSVADVTFSEDRTTDMQMEKNLLKNTIQNYHVEKRYVHKDGTIIWVNLAVVLLRDGFEEPLYFLKIIRDITQLKLLMYELKKEKEKFKKIIEFIPMPIIIYSEDGNMLFVNKVFKETLGYTYHELNTIHSFTKKMFPNEDKQMLKELEAFYKNPTIKEIQEQTLISKTGEKKSVLLNIATLNKEDSTENNTYIIAMIDITDIQEKDELMMAQSRQAAMGEMLSMIAHQWRQPLTVISMVGNNLQADMDLGEEITEENLHELIATLNEQTNYLSQTVDDFRNFFKSDKEQTQTNITTLLQNIKKLIIKSLENNNIKLELPKMSDIMLLTYPNQLTQVLINIINNAKDALVESNRKDATITIGLNKKKNELLIYICDNGKGIDASVKDKLGQAYVSTKSKNGTGLGLYMSIIIVNKHLNGRLYWESNTQGACFYIALPIE